MTSTRRSLLSKASVAAAAGTALGFPMIARAQQNFSWKMTSAYGKGSPFYMEGPGSATDLAKRIDVMSGGRLKIQVFGAGELIPALEGFDAVRAGTVEMNHANSYFWTGKTFAAQYFTAVPFGLNFQGINGWLYDGGGQQLWNEVYAPFGMVAMPCGNTGVQMTGWFKKEIKSVADLKGLKMRIPGLAEKVLAIDRFFERYRNVNFFSFIASIKPSRFSRPSIDGNLITFPCTLKLISDGLVRNPIFLYPLSARYETASLMASRGST